VQLPGVRQVAAHGRQQLLVQAEDAVQRALRNVQGRQGCAGITDPVMTGCQLMCLLVRSVACEQKPLVEPYKVQHENSNASPYERV